MKQSYCAKLLLFAACLIPFPLFAQLKSNENFQIWNSDGMDIPISKKVHFAASIEFRYNTYKKNLYHKHYQGGFRFLQSPYIHWYLAYRHIYHRTQKKWAVEYDPLFDLTFQIGSRRGLFLSNRNRIQYRILGEPLGGKNRCLYRNRTEVIPPYRLFRYPIAFYFADEFFWQEGRGIDQNRLEAGLKIPYHHQTHVNLVYCWRLLKNPQKQWLHQKVIRFDFRLHF